MEDAMTFRALHVSSIRRHGHIAHTTGRGRGHFAVWRNQFASGSNEENVKNAGIMEVRAYRKQSGRGDTALHINTDRSKLLGGDDGDKVFHVESLRGKQ